MFSSLANTLDKQWCEKIENRFITFITPDEYSVYQVFSVYQVEDNSYYTQTNFSENGFQEYINTALSNSIYDFDTSVSKNDKLITLVTCGSSNSKRIILQAKKLS